MHTMRTLASKLSAALLLSLPTLAFGTIAAANETGSLLVYPCFDNHFGSTTVLNVVNTSATGSIGVEFIYIEGGSCLEFNRSIVLTPKDTYGAVTGVHFPDLTEGYVYAFAKNPTSGEAVSWDHLAGTLHLFSGINQLGFQVNPYVFRSAIGTE